MLSPKALLLLIAFICRKTVRTHTSSICSIQTLPSLGPGEQVTSR
jgi:hypothetical protein